MDTDLLILTHRSLHNWLTQCTQSTVSTDKKLEILMLSIADLCQALTGLDGNQLAEREAIIMENH